jgi:hypothetical protein
MIKIYFIGGDSIQPDFDRDTSIIEIWYVFKCFGEGLRCYVCSRFCRADTPENIPVYGKVIFPEEDRK